MGFLKSMAGGGRSGPYLALLERKPGGFDYARPLENWQLPNCYALLRRRLEAADPRHGTRPLNPVLQRAIILNSIRPDQHPTRHRPARNIELPDIRFEQCRFIFVGADSSNERVFPIANQQIAIQQETDPLSHVLL